MTPSAAVTRVKANLESWVPSGNRHFADKTAIFQYVFGWEQDRRDTELCTGSGRTAIALGITSLVNHSNRPNAVCRRWLDTQEIELRAIHTIKAGEEIVIGYDA